MLDAAGGSVTARRATSLGTALSRADALRHASAATPSVGVAAHDADAWSSAFFEAADQGWIRRERGCLLLTAAGRVAVHTSAAQADSRARELLKQLAELPRRELRERAKLR
jgi:hypothetical protein